MSANTAERNFPSFTWRTGRKATTRRGPQADPQAARGPARRARLPKASSSPGRRASRTASSRRTATVHRDLSPPGALVRPERVERGEPVLPGAARSGDRGLSRGRLCRVPRRRSPVRADRRVMSSFCEQARSHTVSAGTTFSSSVSSSAVRRGCEIAEPASGEPEPDFRWSSARSSGPKNFSIAQSLRSTLRRDA